MKTKEDGWSSKKQQQKCSLSRTDNNQFNNVNLNLNKKCLNNESHVQSFSNSNNTKYSAINVMSGYNVTQNNYHENGKEMNKSTKEDPFQTPKYLKLNKEVKEEDKKRWKDDKNTGSNLNNSTLSLHIAAYENTIERAADEILKDLPKKTKSMEIITSSIPFQTNQVNFEFPRQMNEEPSTPEIQQFTASQRLFSPNQNASSSNNKAVTTSSVSTNQNRKGQEWKRKDITSSSSLYSSIAKTQDCNIEDIVLLMENTAAAGRSRRQVTKRVAFSPEPASTSQSKKATPVSKSSTNKRKSNASEKKASASRKSLPATLEVPNPSKNDILNKSTVESSSVLIDEKSTPEAKRKRLKLKKPLIETPPSSNGIKSNKNAAQNHKKAEEQTPKASKQADFVQPRAGLLALKRYLRPPETISVPESSQAPSLAATTSSSQNHFHESLIEEKDKDIPVDEEIPISSTSPPKVTKLIEEKDKDIPVDEEFPINSTSPPNVTEGEASPFKEIENDNAFLTVDKKADSLTEKLKDKNKEDDSEKVADPVAIVTAIPETQTAVVNDSAETDELKNGTCSPEKAKPISEKVSPLKISLLKHRPSLPALPTKSPPVIIERPSFSGRTRKPPASKEYPGHEEALPSSSHAPRKRSKVNKPPSIPPTSIPPTATPMTPIPSSVADLMNLLERAGDLKIERGRPSFDYSKPTVPSPVKSPPLQPTQNDLPAHLAAYLPERPQRHKSKQVSDFAPSLVSKDIKRKSLSLPEEEQAVSLTENAFIYPSVETENAFIYPSVESISIEDDPISIEEDIDVPESFEIDDSAIFDDQIGYLKSLHPHLEKSFEHLETRFEDEYFLREILTQDIIDSEVFFDAKEELYADGIEEPSKNVKYNLTSSTMKFARVFIQMFKNIDRVSFEEIPNHIQTFLDEKNATGISLKIFYEILQKQCCMEIAVQKHANPLASFYLYSLQNATLLRSKIFLHFSYELVQAHEWLIRHLEEQYLASYLMLLKFLQAAGTTLTNVLITSANPTDLTNVTVNGHIRDMLEEKIRDPFSRMLTHLDRKLSNHETFLMLISPGIKLQTDMTNAVYHAHEQLFVGLTNMGCTIEKIIIKDDDNLPENFTVADACDFAINFIKNKIIDVVKRRPNDRIFIASWGVTCLLVHEAVIDIDGVSGIIDMAMPVHSKLGNRGKIGDKILLTYCPTIVVTGEDSGEVPATAEMLNNFNISSGLCVVGKGDSSLIVEPSLLASYGITQACISRMILDHVMDFIERVVKDTHNDIHTKKIEVDYPWIITEDLNDHVMRDDNAYNVDETFFDDEEEPSSIPKESIVVAETPKIEESPLDQEVIIVESPLQPVKAEPEPVQMSINMDYPGNFEQKLPENVKSEIIEHPLTYEYTPGPYYSSYPQQIYYQPGEDTGNVLDEFLDEGDVVYQGGDVPMVEGYDDQMEYEEQMAAEAIQRGHTGEHNNGYE